MDLSSARQLKAEVLRDIRRWRAEEDAREAREHASPAGSHAGSDQGVGEESIPHSNKPSIAVGICSIGDGCGLAIRVQDPALLSSPLLDSIIARAHGEVDVRFIGIVRPL